MLTHFDTSGNAVIVDITDKPQNLRMATAVGAINMSQAAYEACDTGTSKKGDVLNIARIAGIMATKQTSSLIPLCHSIPIEKVTISFEMRNTANEICVACTVQTTGKTGVEMEALCGVTTTLLTIYDMLKAIDKSMTIQNIFLEEKHGGKSGVYKREPQSDTEV